MIRLTIHLPARLRLDLNLVKTRKSGINPFVEKLGSALRARKGNKFSRLARHIFEHNKVRKVLGTNLALLVVASSLLPGTPQAQIDTTQQDTVVKQDQVPLTTDIVVQYPVKKISITQGYRFTHPGFDLDGITGDPIGPIMAGEVEAITNSSYAFTPDGILSPALGKAVLISHGDGTSTVYAHLSEINVEVGQKVTTKDVIGKMGSTGRSTGDHLHIEVHKNGIPVSPYTVLPPQR